MHITEHNTTDGVMLHADGPLVAGAPQTLFQNAVWRVLRAGHRRILVNLKKVPSIDAAGIGALVETATTARAAGIVLVLSDLAPRVRHVLKITGLLDTFEIVGAAEDYAGRRYLESS